MRTISVMFDPTHCEFYLPNPEISLKQIPTDPNLVIQTLSFCNTKAKEIENHRTFIKRVLLFFNIALFLFMTLLVLFVFFKLNVDLILFIGNLNSLIFSYCYISNYF